MKSFAITKTNLFLFHWIFKNRGGGVQANPRTQPGSATKHFTTCTTLIKNEPHVVWAFRHLTSVVSMLSRLNKTVS